MDSESDVPTGPPPAGPPPGPPPAAPPPPPPPTGPPGPPVAATEEDPRRKWLIPAAVIAAVVVILAFVLTQNDDPKPKAAAKTAPGEIFLQPIAESGPDPFGPSVAGSTPSSTIPPDTPITFPNGGTAPVFKQGGGSGTPSGPITVTARSGGTPGLYGGTRDQSSCDKPRLIDFLVANPSKAQAWADVQGISLSDVPSYIGGLTPVLLRSDTRVTNHGFKNGRPTPMQSILQAGTAVLVDNHGVPRARCACGNPLLPPLALSGPPTYEGPPWTGFSPTNITVINNSTTVINVITIIDINTGTPFGRGPNGPDLPLPPGGFTTTTRGGTGTTPTTAPRSSTTVGNTSTFRLTNIEPKNGNPTNWSVDGPGGKVHGNFGPGQFVDYQWSVPQTLNPVGTKWDYSGAAQGNIAVDINIFGSDGVTFDQPNVEARAVHAYSPGGASGQKSVIITIANSVNKVEIKMGMGFAVEVIYTYER